MRPLGLAMALLLFVLGAQAPAPDLLAVGLAPLAIYGLARVTGRSARRLRLVALGGLFLTAGGLRGWPALDDGRVLPPPEPERVVVVGQVAAVAPRSIDLVQVRRVSPGPPLPRRLRIYEGDWGSTAVFGLVSPGWQLRVEARLGVLPGPRNPGGPDLASRFAARGIGARGWRLERARVVRERFGASGWPDRALDAWRGLRTRSVVALQQRGRGGALLAALALGARDPEAVPGDAFRALGLSHLLAISGLHLALVGWSAYRLFLALRLRFGPALRGDPRVQSLVLSCAAAAVYAALAGGGLPVRRAWIMWCAWAGACALRRPSTRFAPLVLAAGMLVVSDPAVVWAPGAQLSFVACAALLLGSPGAGAPARSAEVIAATAPVAALGIGVLSLWAWLANLVAVPWTALVLLPAALVASVATVLPGASGEALLALCAAIGTVSVSAAEVAAEALPPPFRASPRLPALVVSGFLVLGVLRTRSLAAKVAGALATTLTLSLAPGAPHSPAAPRVVVLDVGQGDASVVQGRRATLLVDGGRALAGGAGQGRLTVLPALAALGVRRLDLAIATHSDLDHRGGLVAVVDEIAVGELWVPWGASREPAFAVLLEAARRRGVRVLERGAGSAPRWIGDLRVVSLWPPREGTGSANDRSLVVRVDVFPGASRRRVSALFPGDIGARAEHALVATGAALDAELLLLPHHGSRTSSSAGFLGAVSPAAAVASASRHHRFGMPHPEVRRRLRERGIPLWHTGRDGAVWVALGRPLWTRGTLPRE